MRSSVPETSSSLPLDLTCEQLLYLGHGSALPSGNPLQDLAHQVGKNLKVIGINTPRSLGIYSNPSSIGGGQLTSSA